VNAGKQTILIVEDDLDLTEMLDAYFNVQGYDVLTAHWGEDGFSLCQTASPDLVILDIRLPDIDGFEVARRMRSTRRTQEIPFIFLTEKTSREDKLRGLELNAEDYITKPFDVQELRLRVRNAMHRNTQGSLTNPITGLPEGALVDERLSECLNNQDWGLILASLTSLDHFRDLYGFVASDDVLRAVSGVLHDAMREVGGPNDFLGHLGPAEFLLITEPGYLHTMKELVRSRLEPSLQYFYRERDRQMGAGGRMLGIRLNLLQPSGQGYSHLEEIKERLFSSKQPGSL
jgi:PleD family two-component response regulator